MAIKKKRQKTTKPKSQHYVNNDDFLVAMSEWKIECHRAEDLGEGRPEMSNFIGECIINIANGVSKMPNFIGYSYRDEMVSDGIENCVRYAHNFDPKKSSNPFSYFTTMCYYAFIRRIKKEKQQGAIKQKCIQNAIDSGMFDGDINNLGINKVIQDLQMKLNSEIESFEKDNKKTKVPKTSSSSSTNTLFDSD